MNEDESILNALLFKKKNKNKKQLMGIMCKHRIDLSR